MNSDDELKCGCCNGKINAYDLKLTTANQYWTTCVLCQQKHILRPKCAFIYFSKVTDLGTVAKISVEEFQTISTPFRCVQCQQQQCFYCSKKHGCKFGCTHLYCT